MKPHSSEGREKRFILSLALTLIIFFAELIGGLWTGSLALLSDAAHVFMDVFALGLSFAALRISARPADDRHTYGWHRMEVLAALINGVTLLVIAVGIGYEAVQRIAEPQPIRGPEMLAIAVVGLVVNLVVAFILGGHDHGHEHGAEHDHAHEHIRRDLNTQSAYLHVLGDAISSVGVIVAAVVVSLTGWIWIDPLMSLAIAVMILFSAVRVTRSALHILNEGAPEGLSSAEISTALSQVAGVSQVHDLHVWNICSGHVALSAHAVLDTCPPRNSAAVMADMRELLLDRFGIEHTTIQMEDGVCSQGDCTCGAGFSPVPAPRQK